MVYIDLLAIFVLHFRENFLFTYIDGSVYLTGFHEAMKITLKFFSERQCENVIVFHFQITQKGESLNEKLHSFPKP